MSRTRLEWAQWAASKGINVFVIQPNSKRPLDGHSWYLRQTDDSSLVESWFEQTPDCNYGCHLGEQFVVIDLDRKPGADGVVAFEELCNENGVENFLLELDTLTVETPSGGYHLYFKSPFPCANRNSFPDGIDVRGVVGYVVGPGSADSRGEWTVLDPEAPIAKLPEWLHGYLEKPGYKDPNNNVPVTELDQQENIDHATSWLQDREPAIEGANGDDWTYETVQWLRDFGLSEGMIVQVLIDSGWNARCEPPWSESELEKKIENAWRYGQNRPGSKAPTYRVERLTSARPEGGWTAHLTEEQMAELFHPTSHLSLSVEEEDDEVPSEVPDDDFDPETGEHVVAESIWHDVLDFSETEKVREYVIYKWLIAHGITHMIAKRGTGKSTVALDMAFHIACDLDWCDIPTQPNWKVIYICGEDDVGMRLNCRAWMKHHGVKPSRDRFLVASDIIRLTEKRRLQIRLKEMIKWADGAPCVVILDTWQRATSGWSKNDQEQMERAVENAEYVARHLHGPMLSCVHPPKDGRMTVVGSGVQEDTSTGIMVLESLGVGKGVKLKIDRMKGPGEGNYVLFEFKEIDLERLDTFNKPLTGIVAHKFGGTEDASKVETLNKEERILRAWGEAIYGVNYFPSQDTPFETVEKLNIPHVSKFLENIFKLLRDEGDPTQKIAAEEFKNLYLDRLLEHIGSKRYTITQNTISKTLKELFRDPTPSPTVIVGDGTEELSYVRPGANTKKSTDKNKQGVFELRERQRKTGS